MKTVLVYLLTAAACGAAASLHAQYQSPRQYLQRLPQTQPPATAQPTLPPGPTVVPPPSSSPAPTAADAAKAAAAKEATLKRTIEFQRKRAEGGSASAQFTLGMRYVQGDGVERNLAEGCKWLRAAAKQDHVWAKRKLGELEKELGSLPPEPQPEVPAGAAATPVEGGAVAPTP